MPKKPAPPPPLELTFEQAFAELEKIVEKLESGELSLDDSLALFERGQTLAGLCGAGQGDQSLAIKVTHV